MWYYIAPVFGAALFIVWKFFINKSVGNLPSPSLSLSPSPSSPSSSKVKIDKENENNNKVQQPPSPINNQQLKPKPQLQRVDTPIRLDNSPKRDIMSLSSKRPVRTPTKKSPYKSLEKEEKIENKREIEIEKEEEEKEVVVSTPSPKKAPVGAMSMFPGNFDVANARSSLKKRAV